MYCQNCDGTDSGYSAQVYGSWDAAKRGAVSCSNSYNFYEGTQRMVSNTVHQDRNYAYFVGALNAYDAASYSGIWYPDNSEGYE